MNNFEDTRKKFRWPSFIIGILFVILSIWAFMNPGHAAFATIWVLVIGMLIYGIFQIFLWYDIGKSGLTRPGMLLFSAILDIILSILIIIAFSNGLSDMAILIIGYMFAFEFIADSISSISMSNLSFHSGANRVLGVLGLILGVILLFNPFIGTFAAVFMIAIYLMVFGILLITRAF